MYDDYAGGSMFMADEGLEMEEEDSESLPPEGAEGLPLEGGGNMWSRQTSRPRVLQQVAQVRRDFPESWIWTEEYIL